MKVTVLFSGGVDSLCVAHWALSTFPSGAVQGVYYDVGQRYAHREIPAATRLAHALRMPFSVVQQGPLVEGADARIPLRNMLFIQWASLESDAVCYGELRGEEPPDKNPRFRRRLQTLLASQRTTPFHIHAPFARYTKAQMVRAHVRLYGVHALPLTVACFSSGDTPCGTCMSCYNRWLAWEENALPLETFEVHPAQAMLDRMRGMHENSRAAEWRSVNVHRIWLRRRWLLESRRQLNRYAYAHHNMSAWKYAHV
jgi:7-cyano-7-deazaguanine synthase in queuosine biosynthesis